MHQRQQRKRFRLLADRMLRQDRCEAHRFVTQLAANGHVCARRKVALGEQEVQDAVDRREPRGPLTGRQLPDSKGQLAQSDARASEPLIDVGFAREQPQRDLPNVETAQGLQRQHELRFDGDGLVAADEQHLQQAVLHFSRKEDVRAVVRSLLGIFRRAFFQDSLPMRSLAQLSHELVVRHPKKPRRRVVRQTGPCPRLERGQQSGLNRVLDRLDVLHTGPARQHRDEPAMFVPEEVLDQLGCGQGVWISLTSTLEPGIATPGDSRATRTASSRLSATTIMKPPTTSLASTKGPSVAPSAVTTFPPPSLPPRSTMLSWNFSFQALNAAYISCIWAGDGFSPFAPGWLRWIQRYLGMMCPLMGSVVHSADAL